MVNFVPGFLKSTTKAYADLADVEEKRLEKIYGKDKPEVEAGVEAWRKANPRPPITLNDVADHMEHIRKVAGADCLGVGADYEGFGHPPKGLEDVSCYPALLAELSRRGFSDEEIKKVAGLNLLRAFRAAEKVSAQLRQTKN
jgi:membrane dipeptidase